MFGDLSSWGGLGLASWSCGIAEEQCCRQGAGRDTREMLSPRSLSCPLPRAAHPGWSGPSESRPYHGMHGGGPGEWPGGWSPQLPTPAAQPHRGGHGGHPMQHNPNGPPPPWMQPPPPPMNQGPHPPGHHGPPPMGSKCQTRNLGALG